MSLGSKESERDWLEHFRSLLRRGLRPPLTVTTDGAPGLTKAVETMCPEAERIRCWVHKMRDMLDKVPEEVRAELKAYMVAIRDAADYKQGERLAKGPPRFRTEKARLKLVLGVLWQASARWSGVRFSQIEQKALEIYLETRQRLQQADRRLADLSNKENATA